MDTFLFVRQGGLHEWEIFSERTISLRFPLRAARSTYFGTVPLFPVPGGYHRPFAVVVDFSVTTVMALSLELFAVVI